jgi:hypothetical protein
MMTSVMMGAYPDIYKAGAVDSGVAYGCFAGNNLWNSQCAQGDLIQSGQAWVSFGATFCLGEVLIDFPRVTSFVPAILDTLALVRASRYGMEPRIRHW